MQSRLTMTARNAFWSYFSMLVSMAIQFVSRTVFIHYLGKDYLGINGLFSSILGVLSFAELGIGTAMNFSLYKPVAEGNTEKIKSYMYCYKWAYRAIAGIITVMGLSLLPFLKYLVKDPGNVGDIRIYYLVFLFNTVTSYFVSYKFSLVNAEQKNYIYTNVNLLISLSTTLVQILTLFIWHNYLAYLLVAAAFGLAQKVFISAYLNHLHPYLKDKNVKKLEKAEGRQLVTKVKALVLHKLGDICVHQTDNIIVSAFLSIGTVGLLSNYNLIINTISSCINILFHSVTGSLGNLVALEDQEKQYKVFKTYRFIGFWFYGFTYIALLTLLTPFITLWIGKKMVLDDFVVALLLLDYYMIGHRICLNNFKTVAGVFEQDRFVPIVQAVVNLVASVVLAKLIGLPGVFIGTIIQGTIASVAKPIIVYKGLFNCSSKYYFIDAAKYGIAVLAAMALCWICRMWILQELTIAGFILMMVIVTVIPNVLFAVLFHKTPEFAAVVDMVRRMLKRREQAA